MPKPKGLPKTGGRVKGTPNKSTLEIRAIMGEVLERVPMADKLITLLGSSNESVQLETCKFIAAYKFGKPKESLELSGNVDYRAIVERMRQRVSDAGRNAQS